MKIALLTDGIAPYFTGGMQKHSYDLARYLAKNRIYVDLYHRLSKENAGLEPSGIFPGEEAKYIRLFPIRFPQYPRLPGHYLFESKKYSKRIFSVLKDHLDVDFIYAQGFCAWELLSKKKNGFKCSPIGVNFHGFEMFQKAASLKSRWEQVLLRTPVRWNLKYSDYVFSFGGKITNLVKQAGVGQECIIELPGAIDRSWLANQCGEGTPGRRAFVFIGRFERRKGIEELHQAIRLFGKQNNFEFHFIGPIPERLRLKSPRISYWGSITDSEEIKRILARCDVLVCPSYAEGMPIVILEAAACGLAVIATDVGAVSLCVNSETGWLISPGDVGSIVAAMREALKIPADALLKKKNRAQDLISKNFLWEKVIADHIRILASLSAHR